MAQIEVRDLTQTTSVLDADSIHIVSGEGNGTSYYINRDDFIESASIDNIEISGGTIDGTPIGGIGPSTGSFTSLDCDTFSCDTFSCGTFSCDTISVDLTAVTASADELNILDGVVASTDDLNLFAGAAGMGGGGGSALALLVLPYVYPVGSLYYNAIDGTSPSTLLGFGTWEAYAAGRVPVGHSGGDPLFGTAESVGGTRDATLVSHNHSMSASGTTASAGTHSHNVTHRVENLSVSHTLAVPPEYYYNGVSVVSSASMPISSSTSGTTDSGAHTHAVSVSGTIASQGVSATNANLQPYITVYIWRRTA